MGGDRSAGTEELFAEHTDFVTGLWQVDEETDDVSGKRFFPVPELISQSSSQFQISALFQAMSTKVRAVWLKR
jgi:hypothetical protein